MGAQILTTVLGFFLLVVVLRKLFWRSVLQLLDDRRRRIEESLQNVARSQQRLDHMQADYTQRLAKIEDEARTKIQQAILEGKRISIEVQEHAREQAQAVMTKAKETMELELAKAKVTLRDQVAAMTMDAVERVLQQKLDTKTDRHVVDTVLEDLERHGR